MCSTDMAAAKFSQLKKRVDQCKCKACAAACVGVGVPAARQGAPDRWRPSPWRRQRPCAAPQTHPAMRAQRECVGGAGGVGGRWQQREGEQSTGDGGAAMSQGRCRTAGRHAAAGWWRIPGQLRLGKAAPDEKSLGGVKGRGGGNAAGWRGGKALGDEAQASTQAWRARGRREHAHTDQCGGVGKSGSGGAS